MIRKIGFIIFLFLLWNFSLVVCPIDVGYLTTFNYIFDISYVYYVIGWFVVCICSVYSFYKLFMDYDLDSNYLFVLIVNYIFTQVFGIFFFGFNDLVLSIIIYSVIVCSSVFVYVESKRIDNCYGKLSIPVCIYNVVVFISLMFMFILY